MNLLSKIYTLIFILIVFFILIFFHSKGVVYYDEGYILNSAARIQDGQIVYRDFDFVYTPLSILTTSLFFNFLGESVLSGRIAAVVISFISLFAIYKIVSLLTSRKIILTLCLLFFIAWGPAHVNFPWPIMFAVSFYLFIILFFLLGCLRKNKIYFFWAGIMVMLVVSSKQNFGVGAFAASVFSFFLINKNKKLYFHYFILGIFFSTFLAVIAMISTDSLGPFIVNMDLYTLKRVVVGKVLDTPFIYEGTILVKLGKLIFYSLPLLISIYAFYLSYRSKKTVYGIISVFTAMFYLLGIRPTTDYTHTVPLLALSSVSLAVIFTLLPGKIHRALMLLAMAILVIFGFYRAYYTGYYKWDWYLRDHTQFARDPRLQVYMTPVGIKNTQEFTDYIKENTKSDDYIFVNYYSPLIYFISQRRNPTAYDLFSPIDIPPVLQKKALSEIKKKNTALIILNSINKNEKSLLSGYIKKEYPISHQIADWVIYSKVKK